MTDDREIGREGRADAPSDLHYPPVAQTQSTRSISERHVGTPAVEGATENVPRSGPAPLVEIQPGGPSSSPSDLGQRLREQVAALCHEQWSGWMRYLFSTTSYPGPTGAFLHGHDVERWQRQMRTPYAELSDAEKDSDRIEADKFLALSAAELARLTQERDDAQRLLSAATVRLTDLDLDEYARRKQAEARCASLAAALRQYGTHLEDCDVHQCQTCGCSSWLHDKANDIDEIACDAFLGKPECTCGFTAAQELQKEPEDQTVARGGSPPLGDQGDRARPATSPSERRVRCGFPVPCDLNGDVDLICPDCREQMRALVFADSRDHDTRLKMVVGALRSCIDAHGPITKALLTSAAKRVIKQLQALPAPPEAEA